MEAAIIVALAGIGTAFVTAAGGVLVAWITNRREAETATEEGVEEVLTQRLILRDEQIAALEMKVRNRDERLAAKDQELAEAHAERAALRAELAHLRDERRGPHE